MSRVEELKLSNELKWPVHEPTFSGVIDEDRHYVNSDTPESYIVELAEGEVLQIGRKPASWYQEASCPDPEVLGSILKFA